MKFTLPNDTARIPPLSDAISEFLSTQGVADAIGMRVSLCLDELLTNTILYGYADQGPHEITVEVAVTSGVLRLDIIDDATPFDPTEEAPEPDLDSPLEDRRIGGLGVHLVRSFVDEMVYVRDPQGRNHLSLRKRL